MEHENADWTVVYEQTATGWGAYVPALPGLGVAGETRAEVEQLIREGIALHLEGIAADVEQHDFSAEMADAIWEDAPSSASESPS